MSKKLIVFLLFNIIAARNLGPANTLKMAVTLEENKLADQPVATQTEIN